MARSAKASRKSLRVSRTRFRRRIRKSGARLRSNKLSSGRMLQARRTAYRLGWEQGYHLGRCRAVVNSVHAPTDLPVLPLRLMYITSGLGMPYAPLDHVISANLGEQVVALTTVRPQDDIVSIAKEFRPDAAIALDGVQMISDEQVDALRALGVRTAAWFVDDPYYTDMTIGKAFRYDIIFTIELSCYELYRELGHPNVRYMPLGVAPQHFQPTPVGPEYQSDVCFIGTAFWNRVHFFDAVAPHLRARRLRIIGLWWDRMSLYRRLRSEITLNRWLSPEDTAKYYNGAKIVVNLHRSSDDMTYNRNSRGIPALSINPRTFEIAGCGSFQLSDQRLDMHRFLMPGSEIVTFMGPEDFVAKVNYYLSNPEARERIALSGLRRTLTEHTYRHRTADMLRVIAESLHHGA